MFNSFGQEAKVINILPPKDINASAHSIAYVDLQDYQHATFIVTCGAVGAVGSSKNISFKQAASTSGSSSANLAIGKYWDNLTALGSASIANDTYAASTVASSGATLALTASTNNQTYIFEFDSSQLTDGLTAIGIAVAAGAAATLVGAQAILTKARYAQALPPSAL